MSKASLPFSCPNKDCGAYRGFSRKSDYSLHGYYSGKNFKGLRRRFLCKKCGKTFSETASDLLSYRLKIGHINSKIFDEVTASRSGCEAARRVGVSEHCVRIRLRRMAQFSYLRHSSLVREFRLKEKIVFDGLRNFAKDQFSPNEINHFVLDYSQFILYFNFVPLNRRGTMSPSQRVKNQLIQLHSGRYPKYATRKAIVNAISWITRNTLDLREEISLISDEHYQYRLAVEKDLNSLNIIHRKISSKRGRNFKNALFPVNFLDNMIRKDSSAFARETLCFNKKHSAMVDRYMLFSVRRNYMMPIFSKEVKSKPEAHLLSPAQMAGVSCRMENFESFFNASLRCFKDESIMSNEWMLFYDGVVPFPRKKRGKGTTLPVGQLETNIGESGDNRGASAS